MRGNNNFKLSIIIPFHNRVELLIKTINSLKENTNKNYEIILIDDGSNDEIYEKVKDYLNEKIKYYKIKNSERGFARNYGAKKATGKYLNFFDSDDLSMNNHVDEFYKFIKKNNLPLVFTNSYFKKKGNKLKKIILKKNINKDIFIKNILSCNSVFIEKNFFLKNMFCENIDLSGSEDWDLWLRIATKTDIIVNNIPTTVLIEHDERSTKIQNMKKIIKRLDLLLERILNKNIININKKYYNLPIAEIYSFKSLTFSTSKMNKKDTLYYFYLTFLLRPIGIFNKRSLVIFKNFFLSFF